MTEFFKYKLNIYLTDSEGGDTRTWDTNYRFIERPDMIQVKFLLNQARDEYQQIYEWLPTTFHVELGYVALDDQEEFVPDEIPKELTGGSNKSKERKAK